MVLRGPAAALLGMTTTFPSDVRHGARGEPATGFFGLMKHRTARPVWKRAGRVYPGRSPEQQRR